MPLLHLSFLGSLEIQANGQLLLKPPTLRSQSLLAYLVMHRSQVLSREKLAGLFWGDRSERKARRSLATALWHIRSCLHNENFLLSDYSFVQINPDESLWVDVEEFEKLAHERERAPLQASVRLYRGMFLDGFYDDWIINQRYRLESLYLNALSRLMGIQEADGAHAEVLSTALRMLENDPLREEAYRIAMRAYCRLGQRHSALRLYQRAERKLQEELGILPVKETRLLYQAILEGRIEIRPVQERVVIPPPVIPLRPQVKHPLEATHVYPLVGREEEFSILLQSWEATLAGGNRLVFIQGEAGVGKTRLVEEFAGYVRRQGGLVLPGRCYAFERLLSYQPVVEVINCLTNLLSEAAWQEVPSWVQFEIQRLIPELPAGGANSSEPLPFDRLGEHERFYEAVTIFIRQVCARTPLLIILEDLQWATESTLSLLHYLIRHLAGEAVLIIATYRLGSGDAPLALAELRNQLEKDGYIRTLMLQPLSEPAFVSLLGEMSGAGEEILPLARRLFQETEGNPFFLTEIIKVLFENGLLNLKGGKWLGEFSQLAAGDVPLPDSLQATILSRVKILEPAVQHALRLAAVLGREFDFEPFSRLCGGDDAIAEGYLDTLLRCKLIEEGSGIMGRDYAFSHHKFQEVIYADLPRRNRQQAHAHAAEALERCYMLANGVQDQKSTSEPGRSLLAELAHHFGQGRLIAPSLSAKAAHYQLAAGDQARRLYANQEAIHFYQQALSILKELNDYEAAARTLMKLGLVYHNAFDYFQARQTYQEAFAFWRHMEAMALHNPSPHLQAPHALRLLASEPQTLDLTRHPNDPSAVILKALFRGLVQQGPQMEILPDLALDWDLLEGGRGYCFHLRRDACWTDGEPVKAADFVAGWQRLLVPGNQSDIASMLYDIRGAKQYHLGRVSANELGVKALDEYTLLVELDSPCGYFLNLMAFFAAFPVPAHQVESFGDSWWRIEHLVTNGPFRLVSWIPGESMLLERNPEYRGRFGGNVQQVWISFIRPWPGGLELYAGNRLDILDISFFQPQELNATSQLYMDDYRCLPRLATGFTGFDTSRPPFDDLRVRQAFTLAIDRQALASLLRPDHVFPASGGFVPPGMPGHNPGIALPYDPQQARLLLAEAGYPNGRGFPQVISVYPQVAASHVVGEFINEQWQDNLSVHIHGQGRPLQQFHTGQTDERPHLFSYAWQADYADPANFLRPSGQLIHTHWRNNEYEALIEQAQRCLDQERRMAIYAQAERILVGAAPIIPLFYLRTHLLVKPCVRNWGDGSNWKDIFLEPDP